MVHSTFISPLILLLSTILLIIAIKVVKTVSPRLNMTNILVLFMIFYVVFAFIGSVILNVSYTEPGSGYLVYNRTDILLKIWMVTSCGLIGIPISVSIVLKSIRFHSVDLPPMKECRLKGIEWISILGLFIICCIVFITYVKKIGGIPLLRYIQDTTLSQAVLRSDATNNFTGKAWRYVLFYKSIPLTLFILVSFSDSRKFRNVLFFYCALICIMNFEKAPLIKLLILIVLIYMRKKGNIGFKQVIFLGFIGFVSLIIMYIFFMNASGGVLHVIKGLLGRAFLTQIIPFFWYFKYTEQIGFLDGTSFPNPAGIFPFEHTRITVEVMNLYREQAGMNSDVVGSMPTVFMADWYVNFGYLGIFLSIVIFVLLLAGIIVFFNKLLYRCNDIYVNTALITIIEHFAWYSGASFSGILFDMNLIIPLCLLFALKCLKNSQFLFKMNIPSRR